MLFGSDPARDGEASNLSALSQFRLEFSGRRLTEIRHLRCSGAFAAVRRRPPRCTQHAAKASTASSATYATDRGPSYLISAQNSVGLSFSKPTLTIHHRFLADRPAGLVTGRYRADRVLLLHRICAEDHRGMNAALKVIAATRIWWRSRHVRAIHPGPLPPRPCHRFRPSLTGPRPASPAMTSCWLELRDDRGRPGSPSQPPTRPSQPRR